MTGQVFIVYTTLPEPVLNGVLQEQNGTSNVLLAVMAGPSTPSATSCWIHPCAQLAVPVPTIDSWPDTELVLEPVDELLVLLSKEA
ncbi:MAG TPA: hypothetical protein EYM69_00515 [Dehalococcoidia bacterium]|nr:hypothetical protein [Dehalococcoidia bacterium]